MAKFKAGTIVITKSADDKLSRLDVIKAIKRHIDGDFGESEEDSININNENIEKGSGRIMSIYTSSNNIKFWIITESDRSFTTVLLPKDY